MKFTIETLNDNGSGMKYTNKEEFLKEISLMIDDCIANGGTFFDAQIDSDVSCFYNDEDDKEDEDEIIMKKYFDIHVVQNDENKEGYSIFVIANDKESAIEKAKNEKMFVSEYDYEDIDNIEEISENEYNAAKNI